jgi:hypothetical protein
MKPGDTDNTDGNRANIRSGPARLSLTGTEDERVEILGGLPLVRMDNFSFGPKMSRPGSSAIWIDVDKDGEHFGELYAFTRRPGWFNPWRAILLTGERRAFFCRPGGGLEAAMCWIIAQ